MTSQNVCKACERTEPIAGFAINDPFGKVCGLCRTQMGSTITCAEPEDLGVVESFIQFTSDYGSIFALILAFWVVHASMHRQKDYTVNAHGRSAQMVQNAPFASKTGVSIR